MDLFTCSLQYQSRGLVKASGKSSFTTFVDLGMYQSPGGTGDNISISGKSENITDIKIYEKSFYYGIISVWKLDLMFVSSFISFAFSFKLILLLPLFVGSRFEQLKMEVRKGSMVNVNPTNTRPPNDTPEIRKYKKRFNSEILCAALWGKNRY